MKKLSLGLLLIVLSFTLIADDSDIALAITKYQSFATNFEADLEFISYEPGEDIREATFKLYENSGRSIVIFKTPARDKDKIILQLDGKYWLYFPKINRTTSLSPIASLAGDASNGDILRPPVDELYKVSILSNIDGKSYVKSEAISRKAPYGSIIHTVQDKKIVYGEFFSRTGYLLKTASYEKHEVSADGEGFIATEVKIIDPKNNEKYTIMRLSNLKTRKIPNSWFTPNNLSAVI